MKTDFLKEYVHFCEEKKLNMFGIAVQQHGVLVDEHRWVPDEPHPLFSLSKSFASTAVGIAVGEGRFGVEDRVTGFFPELLPEKVGENLAAMTVRDLLTMSCGHTDPVVLNGKTPACEDWARAFLAVEPDRKPGEKFVYDSGCTYMLSRIIQKTTGEDMLDYLRPRLFDPLKIENPVWDRCPLGYSLGGTGLHLRTKQILPFGQLYLQKGRWEGKQLIPEAWVTEATRYHISTKEVPGFFPDKQLGYGYQFWMGRQGTYRASGAHGQGCFVIPFKDAVIAYNAHTPDMQSLLEGLWDIVIPAL